MAKTRSAEDPAAVQARESRRLSTLLEISHALSGTLNLRSALHRTLEILAKHHGTVRSLIVFLHDKSELHVEAADGLDAPSHSVRYRLGEGIVVVLRGRRGGHGACRSRGGGSVGYVGVKAAATYIRSVRLQPGGR